MFDDDTIVRRSFLKAGATATAGLILGKTALGGAVSNHEKPVRIGFVGVGHRGTDHVRSAGGHERRRGAGGVRH